MEPFGPFLDGYHDVADQLAAQLRRRADAAFAQAGAERAALNTPAAFAARRQRLREGMLDSIGGLPDLPARVPATCTGVVEDNGFTIERLLLETLPGVLATANLYLPRAGAGRLPAVLFLSGHARQAKAHDEYQRVCRSLARAGIAALALDPAGQGERLQSLDPETGAERVGWGTTEHSYAGLQCSLAGASIARYFIADAMQALTYLASRPELDPSRLGVTGNSGGGTQSAYLIFLDERLACGAPCTYITSRQAYMATGQPHDAEQNIWRAVAMGLDYADLAAGLAPRPLLLGAVAGDFFRIDGTLEAYAHLRQVYGLFGRAEDVYLTVAPGTHFFSDALRETVVRFFRRHLLGQEVDLPRGLASCAPPAESPLGAVWAVAPEPSEHIPAEALRVTARGQVALEHPAARTVFELNAAQWRARPRPSPPEALAHLRQAVLGDRPQPPLWVREIASGPGWARRYTFSEPDIAVPLILLGSQGEGPLAVVALREGTPAVAARGEVLAALAAREGRLLLFDARGCGAAAQRPVNPRSGPGPHGSLHKLNSDAMMLGDTLLAMRAFDALRVLQYAHRIARQVRVLGEGSAGLALLLAANLDGSVAGGCFAGLPATFSDLVERRYVEADYPAAVHGLHRWPDIPDLLAGVGATAVPLLEA